MTNKKQISTVNKKRNVTVNKKQGLIIGGALVLLILITVCVVVSINESSQNPNSSNITISGLNGDVTEVTLHDGENLIASAGIYKVSGNISGYIHINTKNDDEVKIILSGATIKNENGPAIYAESNGNLFVELEGENFLNSQPTEDLDSALYCKGDLVMSALDGAILKVESTMDGIAGKDSVEISSGEYIIKSEGKAIKSKDDLVISGGNYTITSTDDAIHSNGAISITGGDFNLSSEDDGIHAETTLSVEDGNIKIAKSYEGIEANIINISGGSISVTASDDGVNATNSTDSGNNGGGMGGGFRAGDAELNISGGELKVDASGDGLDSNGSITISGGKIYIDGPTTDADSAVDSDGDIAITGGSLIAVGSSGMAKNATTASQPSVLINLTSSYSGALKFGSISYTPARKYNSVFISSSELKTGSKYDLIIDNKTVETVEISDNITTVGGNGMQGGMGGGFRPDDRTDMTPPDANGEQPMDRPWEKTRTAN